MPERPSSDKRREMETYRKLHLDRESKSFIRRQRAEKGRLYLYIGDRNSDRPWLKVLRADYEKQWKLSAIKIISEIPQDTGKHILDFYKSRIERDVYDTLSAHHTLITRLDAQFLKQNGRRMTPHEKSVFISTAKRGEGGVVSASAPARATTVRKRILNDLLQKIEDTHRHHAPNLQQAWAQIVGEEAAQETLLEKVDAQSGIAYCRCMNPTLRFKIQKIPGLSHKLARLLGMNIQKILFR